MNPDLLVPSADQSAHRVPAPVALTPPIKTYQLPQAHYFVCTVPSASFHRADGKKIPFVKGFCKSDLAADVEYLDEQIAHGNPYLRRATDDEVATHKMQVDPVGTLKEQLTPAIRKELEGSLRSELEAKIRAEMAAAAGQGNSIDGQKLAGVDSGDGGAKVDLRARVNASVTGGPKVQPAPAPAHRPVITPVSTDSLGSNAAPSNSK